jgi:hypothetical protein
LPTETGVRAKASRDSDCFARSEVEIVAAHGDLSLTDPDLQKPGIYIEQRGPAEAAEDLAAQVIPKIDQQVGVRGGFQAGAAVRRCRVNVPARFIAKDQRVSEAIAFQPMLEAGIIL